MHDTYNVGHSAVSMYSACKLGALEVLVSKKFVYIPFGDNLINPVATPGLEVSSVSFSSN